jgi:hypothetical protein
MRNTIYKVNLTKEEYLQLTKLVKSGTVHNNFAV